MVVKFNNQSKIVIILFVITIAFWVTLLILEKSFVISDELLANIRKFTQLPLFFIPLIGGLFGLKNAFNWGGRKSVLGKAVLGISLGLLTWAGGMIIWNYYLFFTDIEVPYPSLADAIFILSWPLWTYGLLQLSKAIGVRFAWKNLSNKKNIFFVSGIIILLSIYLLFGIARNWSISFEEESLKLFFDLFYPIGSIVISTLVLLIYWLSKNFLGGIYKNSILILFFGFLLNYMSDFMFSYTTTKGTYFNGHFVDFLFTLAMFTLSFGLSTLNSNILDSEKRIINL